MMRTGTFFILPPVALPCSAALLHVQGNTTAADRAGIPALIRRLEHDPMNEKGKEWRTTALGWLMKASDVRVGPCTDLMRPMLKIYEIFAGRYPEIRTQVLDDLVVLRGRKKLRAYVTAVTANCSR